MSYPYLHIGAVNENARANTIPALYAQIMYLLPDMYSVGFTPNMATTYAVSQMMLESNWMTSNLANVDNNYSGIKFVNQPGAIKGLPSPDGGNYAHYASFKDWAKDFYRVLSINKGKGRPIDATTAQQYYNSLLANHYFTDPNYSPKFNAALRKVSEALAWGRAQDKSVLDKLKSGQTTFTYEGGKGVTSNDKFNADQFFNKIQIWATDHPVPAVGVGILVAIGIKKFFD